jgi:hypothetical protein
MQAVTTKKREFAPALMARIDACAYIFMADKPEKINAIMADRNVPELEAGRIYTIGALKAAKRRGTAKNYREALEVLEAEQVGDRGSRLTRTISADNTARTIQRINRANGNGYISGTYGYTTVIDNTVVYGPVVGTVHNAQLETKKRDHTRYMGKILGTMYADMEFRQERLDPVYDAHNTAIGKNLRVFFKEYQSRLSKTVRQRLTELAEYIDRESAGNVHKAKKVIYALVSAKGRQSPETSKMAKFATNLHYNFEHKDAVTCPDFVCMLYKYGMLPSA